MTEHPIELPGDIDLSEYNPQVHPGLLVEHMKHGYSLDSFGAVCGVSQREVDRWLKSSIPFRLAYERGHAQALLHWETIVLNGLEVNGNINTKLLLMLGEKRFSDYGSRTTAIVDNQDKTVDPIVEMKRIIGK